MVTICAQEAVYHQRTDDTWFGKAKESPDFSNRPRNNCSYVGRYKISPYVWNQKLGLYYMLVGHHLLNNNAWLRNILIHTEYIFSIFH